MELKYFILQGKQIVPCSNLVLWSQWFDIFDRHVARTQIGDFRVSTYFIGIESCLFETTICTLGNEDMPVWEERCATWEEAEAEHERACAEARRRMMQ